MLRSRVQSAQSATAFSCNGLPPSRIIIVVVDTILDLFLPLAKRVSPTDCGNNRVNPRQPPFSIQVHGLFLSRNAMQARHMPSCGVCLSVRVSRS